MQPMSQAEYAQHRGVSRQAVHKLVKAGKITLLPGGKIDPVAADFALGENRERVNVREVAEPTPLAAVGGGDGGGGLTKAKTATEVYRARMAQLEYEQKIGRVLAIDDVTRSMERCAETIVRDIDQLPARADDLASAFTRNGVPGLRAALKELARTMRASLADNMRLLGAEEQDADEEAA